MDKIKKRVLVLSYFPPSDSGSMSLWTSDKILALKQLGYSVDLITSPIEKVKQIDFVKVYQVYSVNPSSFWSEYNSGKIKRGLLLLPIIYSLGLIQELLERITLKRIGDGMWGWLIPSLFKSIFLRMRYKYDLVLSLGGPTSSHLTTAIFSRFFLLPCVIEFMDPIVGEDIGHNSRSAYYFKYLEKFLVSSPIKIVFVTREAALECIRRYPSKNNINYIYTSSPASIKSIALGNLVNNSGFILKIGYFGEMYSTRNYNTLFSALKKIDSKELGIFFELDHYGGRPTLDLNGLENILRFDLKSNIKRINAMQEALTYSLLLIVQHSDERSKITFPYKTWDYLNLERPILALLNNNELKSILDDLGHYTCNVNDVDSIVGAILRFINDYKTKSVQIKSNPYIFIKQVEELIK